MQDEWLTTEVLTQTLDQFATAADTQEEYNAAVKKFVDQGYTQEQAKEMADMAKTAGDAATKVKTFSQLIDTLKEALGSGWTKTWQLIIGDFDEGEAAKNIDKAGKMISKIGKTMLLIVGVIKLFSMLSVDEVENGLNFAGVFLGFVIAYLAISDLAGDKIDSVGKMVKSIVVSMGLMVGVVKLVSKLEPGEMGKGAAFAAVFAGFVWLLVKITKSNEKIMDGLGKLLLSVSASMLIMVGVAKLAGQLSVGEIIKAIAFAGAFLLFIKALKKITTDSGTGETVKLAGTVLAVSVAIGILAGIAVLLGLVDIKQLAKGVLAVTLLGAIMTAMIWATRGANDVKGNVIAMAVAIGVMAAAVAALSMIDSTKLAIATACLGSLMGMFALIELAGNKAKGSITMIATMVIAVAALAGILGIMSALQVENALPNALALSALLLSLSVSMAIIGEVGTISAKALISVGVLLLTQPSNQTVRPDSDN